MKYNEDSLIEQPATEIFRNLCYSHLDCFHETFGDKGTLSMQTSSEVVLIPKLKDALTKLKPYMHNSCHSTSCLPAVLLEGRGNPGRYWMPD